MENLRNVFFIIKIISQLQEMRKKHKRKLQGRERWLIFPSHRLDLGFFKANEESDLQMPQLAQVSRRSSNLKALFKSY